MSNDNSRFPVIRIELESMKQTLTAAVSEHLLQMDMFVRAAIEEAVNKFDYPGVIRQAAKEVIESELKYIVGGSLHEAIRSAAYDGKFADDVKVAVLSALRCSIRRITQKKRERNPTCA
jgi:hypothetical protein